jgi:hypothetical protein
MIENSTNIRSRNARDVRQACCLPASKKFQYHKLTVQALRKDHMLTERTGTTSNTPVVTTETLSVTP